MDPGPSSCPHCSRTCQQTPLSFGSAGWDQTLQDSALWWGHGWPWGHFGSSGAARSLCTLTDLSRVERSNSELHIFLKELRWSIQKPQKITGLAFFFQFSFYNILEHISSRMLSSLLRCSSTLLVATGWSLGMMSAITNSDCVIYELEAHTKATITTEIRTGKRRKVL